MHVISSTLRLAQTLNYALCTTLISVHLKEMDGNTQPSSFIIVCLFVELSASDYDSYNVSLSAQRRLVINLWPCPCSCPGGTPAYFYFLSSRSFHSCYFFHFRSPHSLTTSFATHRLALINHQLADHFTAILISPENILSLPASLRVSGLVNCQHRCRTKHGYGTSYYFRKEHGLIYQIQPSENTTDLLVDDLPSTESPATGSWECPHTYEPDRYAPFLNYIADLTGTRVTYDELGHKVDVLGKNAAVVEQTIERFTHLHSALV